MNLNPHSANIDLTTSDGRKLYQQVTKGIEGTVKINLTKADAPKLMEALLDVKGKFAMGKTLCDVQTNFNANGVPTGTADILKEYCTMTVDQTVISGGYTFGSTFVGNGWEVHNFEIEDFDPAVLADVARYQKTLKSVMLGEWMYNSLSDSAKSSLNVNRKLFEYRMQDGSTVRDGVTMILIALKRVSPNTRVGISNVKSSLSKVDLAQFKGDIGKMCVSMLKSKQDIEDMGGNHEDFVLNVFSAAERSKSSKFVKYVNRIRDEWESDETDVELFSADALIEELTTRWNNMDASDSNATKMDPPDAKIIALTTKVSTLKTQIQSMQKGNGMGSGGGNAPKSFVIEEWRKSKTLGDSVERDGKQWHWCSKHMNSNGLYVTHKEADHGEWEENKKNNRRGKTDKRPTDSSNKPPGSTSNLQISDRMKTALATKGFTSAQAEEFVTQLESGTDFW